MKGLRNGFRVGCNNDMAGDLGKAPKNMPSARDRPEVVDEYLAEDMPYSPIC